MLAHPHHKRGLLGGLGNSVGGAVGGLANGADSLLHGQGVGNHLNGNKATTTTKANNGGGSAQTTPAQQQQPQPTTTPAKQTTTPAAQQTQPASNQGSSNQGDSNQSNDNTDNNNTDNNNSNNNNNNNGGAATSGSPVDSGAGASNTAGGESSRTLFSDFKVNFSLHSPAPIHCRRHYRCVRSGPDPRRRDRWRIPHAIWEIRQRVSRFIHMLVPVADSLE